MTHTPTTAGPPRDAAPDRQPGGSPPYGPGLTAQRPGPSSKPPLRPDIQNLRGLAVTLVVLAHAGVPYVTGGYTGVDVFFVVSGFLITSGLLREADGSGSFSLRRFYARRALRILPLATLVSLATIVGCRLFASKIRYAEFMHDALAGALYVVNVDLARSGTDYLREGSSPSPFQHLWSLSVEEQFYLLWPVLLLVSLKMIRHPWLRALPLAALCLVSYALGVRATETSPSWAYFGPHTRLWELGVGALMAFGAGALGPMPRQLASVSVWSGLVGIAAAATLYGDDTPFPGHFALLPALGTALVIAGGCRAKSSPSAAPRLVGLRPATWVGDLSYGWYLWHWPLLMIGPAALGRPAGLRLNLALCAVALLLAKASLHLVENPVRFNAALRRRPMTSVAFGLGLSATVVSVALVSTSFPPPISSTTRAPGLADALATAPDPDARLAGLLGTSTTALPRNLTPRLADIKKKRSAVYRDKCHVDYIGTRSPACVYGDPSATEVVVLYGDSHAAQWFPALEQLSRRYGWKLVSLTKSSCKTADITTVNGHGPYTSCDTWRKDTMVRIARLRPMLVVASSSEVAKPLKPMKDPRRDWTAGYERVYERLARSADHVAVLLDTPWPTGDPVECASAHPLRLEKCEPDQLDAIKDPARREANRQGALRAGATVIDPKPWLCPRSGRCPVLVSDTFVYRDDSHMAETYAGALAPVLGQELRKLGFVGG